MKTKKIMAIFAILMIALGIAGYAYASWHTSLYIDGTVNTGTFSVEWSVGDGYDDELSNKDYSNITGDIEDNTLYVTVENAYPCINYSLPIDIENTGTIPVHIYFGELSDDFPGTVTIEGLPVDGGVLQLHPGDTWHGTIHVHLAQEAQQGYTYSFGMDVYVVQWNEPD